MGPVELLGLAQMGKLGLRRGGQLARLVRPCILSYSGPYQSLDLTDGPDGQATSPIPNFPI